MLVLHSAPARSGSRAPRFSWPARPPPRPRVKTSFFSAHLWTGLPAPSSTHSATGPGASEPMKAQGAPSRDRTVQELDALPPRCHLWDKHLQNTRRVPAAPAGWCGYG